MPKNGSNTFPATLSIFRFAASKKPSRTIPDFLMADKLPLPLIAYKIGPGTVKRWNKAFSPIYHLTCTVIASHL
jgi:hypothetical protein